MNSNYIQTFYRYAQYHDTVWYTNNHIFATKNNSSDIIYMPNPLQLPYEFCYRNEKRQNAYLQSQQVVRVGFKYDTLRLITKSSKFVPRDLKILTPEDYRHLENVIKSVVTTPPIAKQFISIPDEAAEFSSYNMLWGITNKSIILTDGVTSFVNYNEDYNMTTGLYTLPLYLHKDYVAMYKDYLVYGDMSKLGGILPAIKSSIPANKFSLSDNKVSALINLDAFRKNLLNFEKINATHINITYDNDVCVITTLKNDNNLLLDSHKAMFNVKNREGYYRSAPFVVNTKRILKLVKYLSSKFDVINMIIDKDSLNLVFYADVSTKYYIRGLKV